MEVDANVVEIGHLTIFLNTEKNGRLLLAYGDEAEVVSDVVALVTDKIQKNHLLSQRVKIHTVTWTRGCLNVDLQLVALGAAIYTFVKDYSDLRKNLQLLSDDLKSLTITVEHTGVVLQGLVYSQTMLSLEEVKQVVKKAKKQITNVTHRLLESTSPYYTIESGKTYVLEAISRYIKDKYIAPAKATGNHTFNVVVGKVKTDICLQLEILEICTILGSEQLEEMCNIRRTNISGSVNKPNMTFTYTITNTWALSLPLIQ